MVTLGPGRENVDQDKVSLGRTSHCQVLTQNRVGVFADQPQWPGLGVSLHLLQWLTPPSWA